MTRTLLAVLVAAFAVGAPPALAAREELVVVADGPSYGDVVVPDAVALDMTAAQVSAASYAMVAVTYRGHVTSYGQRLPGSRWDGFEDFENKLLAGRSRIQVNVPGRTTFRIPARGLGRVLTVRLTRRLPGAVAVSRTVTPDVTGRVADEIRLSMPARGVVAHLASRTYDGLSLAESSEFCVSPAEGSCPRFSSTGVGPGTGESITETFVPMDLVGAARAYYATTGVSPATSRVTHAVLTLPLA